MRVIIILLYIGLMTGLITVAINRDRSLKVTTKNLMDEMCEQAYFEGQKDAINGDVRIKKISDTSWVWIKSPWDSGIKPVKDTLN